MRDATQDCQNLCFSVCDRHQLLGLQKVHANREKSGKNQLPGLQKGGLRTAGRTKKSQRPGQLPCCTKRNVYGVRGCPAVLQKKATGCFV